ncbi:hypothetical protein ON010_g14918 [Phytophthora cinnamomi]|nr:hypothetical protein ON010_g14918 [Phytophthora cinnamomi]
MATPVHATRLHDHAIRYSGCSITPTLKHIVMAATLQRAIMAAATTQAAIICQQEQQHQCVRERPTPSIAATFLSPAARDRQAYTPWQLPPRLSQASPSGLASKPHLSVHQGTASRRRAGQHRRHALAEPPAHAHRHILVDHADTGVTHAAVLLRQLARHDLLRSRSQQLVQYSNPPELCAV